MERFRRVSTSTLRTLVLVQFLLLSLCGTVAFAQPWTVEGRVVDEQGSPIRAVAVLLPAFDPQDLARSQRERQAPQPLARLRTDGEGRFRLLVEEPGVYAVEVTARRHLGARADLGPVLGDRSLPDVALPGASRVEARIRGPQGAPIYGLEVSARSWSDLWRRSTRQGWWPRTQRVVSDEDGVVELPCASGEEIGLVAATTEWILHHRVACGAEEPVELEPTGRWLPAEIDAERLGVEGRLLGFYRWPLVAFGQTDDDGILWVPVAKYGKLPIWLSDGAGSFGQPEIGTDPERPEVLWFGMPDSVVVTGQVLDDRTGAPLAEAWLWVGRGAHLFQRTDSKGRFRIRLPADDDDPLRFGAVGYGQARGPAPGDVRSPLTIRLEPALDLRGRVVDAAGSPVVGAELTLTTQGETRTPTRATTQGGNKASSPPTLHSSLTLATQPSTGTGPTGRLLRRGRSNDAGRFEWRGLDPDPASVLWVRLPGYRDLVATLADLPTTAEGEALVTLELARRFEGRVVDGDERPLPGARVELLEAVQGRGSSSLGGPAGQIPRTRSDDDGEYVLYDVPAGTYYLVGSAPGFPELAVPGIEIEPGEAPVDLGTLVLTPGVTLSGRVVDSERHPQPGAQLSLRRADGAELVMRRDRSSWFANTKAGAAGSYHFAGLPAPSRLVVLATAEGFLPWQEEVVLDGEGLELEVELSRGSHLRGWVVASDGTAVGGAWLSAEAVRQEWDEAVTGRAADLGLGLRRVKTDPEGVFDLGPLPEGRYRVQALDGTSAASIPQVVDLGADGLDGLVVELGSAGQLSGRVLDAEGRPVAGARIAGWLEGGFGRHLSNHREIEPTDGAGRFEVPEVAPGFYQVRAFHSSYGKGKASRVEVGEGQAGYVELRLGERLSATAWIRGRVDDGDGRPVAGAQVHIRTERPVWTRSQEDGRFEVEAPVGSVRLAAHHRDHGTAFGESLELGPGGIEGVRLRLEQESIHLRGRVEGIELESLSRLSLVAQGPFHRIRGTVGYDGGLRFEGLTPGRWWIEARLGDVGRRVSQVVTLEPGEEDAWVELVFSPGHRVAGWALREGIPLATGEISIRCEDGSRTDGRTGVDGRFSVPDVAEGPCTVRLTDRDLGDSIEQAIEVVGDLETTLELAP